MLCERKDIPASHQHLYQQDLQETRLSTGDCLLGVLQCCTQGLAVRINSLASPVERMLQVIQFAQDLALDELEIETCGCLGELFPLQITQAEAAILLKCWLMNFCIVVTQHDVIQEFAAMVQI